MKTQRQKQLITPSQKKETDKPNQNLDAILEDKTNDITGVDQEEEQSFQNFDFQEPEEEIVFEDDVSVNDKNAEEEEETLGRSHRKKVPPSDYIPAFKGKKYAFVMIVMSLLEKDKPEK